jgi:hypothetical protein
MNPGRHWCPCSSRSRVAWHKRERERDVDQRRLFSLLTHFWNRYLYFWLCLLYTLLSLLFSPPWKRPSIFLVRVTSKKQAKEDRYHPDKNGWNLTKRFQRGEPALRTTRRLSSLPSLAANELCYYVSEAGIWQWHFIFFAFLSIRSFFALSLVSCNIASFLHFSVLNIVQTTASYVLRTT